MKEILKNKRKLTRIGIMVDCDKKKLFYFIGNKDKGMYLFKSECFEYSFDHFFFSVCLNGICLICEDLSTPFQLPSEYQFLSTFSKDSFLLYSDQIQLCVVLLLIYKNRFNRDSSRFKIPNIILSKIFDFLLK